MYIYSELPKIKLSLDLNITIVAFRNKKMVCFFHLCFSFFLFGFVHFSFSKNNVLANPFPAIPNLSELTK